jgi:hypothetical protein
VAGGGSAPGRAGGCRTGMPAAHGLHAPIGADPGAPRQPQAPLRPMAAAMPPQAQPRAQPSSCARPTCSRKLDVLLSTSSVLARGRPRRDRSLTATAPLLRLPGSTAVMVASRNSSRPPNSSPAGRRPRERRTGGWGAMGAWLGGSMGALAAG